MNEEPKTTRKKKLDLAELWAKCQTCLEPVNLEHLIRYKSPTKNIQGIELYGSFTYLYFCSESCKGLWKG